MGIVLAPYSFNLQGGYPDGMGGFTTIPPLPPSGDWQLPAANYITSKLAGRIISPRPDVETDANSKLAYYRYNHSEMDYKVRICVKGMAWPFQYSIITAPAGTTIGAELDRAVDGATGKTVHTWGADYAVVTWTSPTAGTETFTIRVTDQEGTTLDITWTTTQDDTKFVFVDSVGGSDAAAGTFAAPLETFQNGLWEGSDTANTFVGKQAVFRAGNYPIWTTAIPSSPILDLTYKPIVYRSFNDEAVTFGTDTGHFRTSGGSALDASFIGILCDGSRTDIANNRIFNMQSINGRHVFWGVDFDNMDVGTSGADNPTCIGFYDNATKREDVAIVDCSISSTVNMQLSVTFSVDGCLVENNTLDGVVIASSNGGYGIHPKDDTSNLTVRANTVIGSVYQGCVEVSNQNTAGQPQIQYQEVCWNTLKNTDERTLKWNASSTTPDGLDSYDYRNTVISTTDTAFRFSEYSTPTPVNLSADAYYGFLGFSQGTNYTDVAPLAQAFIVTDFDVNAKLTGTARTTYLGTKGAEVAS